MIRHLGHLPRRDETLNVGEYRLTAVEVSAERVRRLRVERTADIPVL
jgi:Mg2+/Co2+ transporter CorC